MSKILVKKPRTYNGRDVQMDGGNIVYKETILESVAREALEKRNATLPPHLKMVIEDYKEDALKKSK